jgi:uncharacterized membrane protein YphA (DoxX/SURF4 family)
MPLNKPLENDRYANAGARGDETLGGVTRTIDDRKGKGVGLWILQGLLAALFLMTGVMKLMMSADTLATQSQLPGPFMKFIAVAEVLGAIGLILPWALGIWPGLTPLAATGLMIITIGATVVTLLHMPPVMAILPCVTAILSGVVAYRRWRQLR